MLTRVDEYDPRNVFDDYYVGQSEAVDCGRAAFNILCSANRRRLRAPVEVVGASFDTTSYSFAVPAIVLGADDKPTGLPIYDALKQRFIEALPQPKMVRVDDDESYEAFRESRRAPYVARLDARLAALENAVVDHISDHHGRGRLPELEAAFDRHIHDPNAHNAAVVGVLQEVFHAGTPVPLPLPEARNGAIACWRDGPEVLCSVRVLSEKGPRIITTAAPLKRAVDETLGAAMVAGVHPDEIKLVATGLAPIVGGLALVPQLCRAASRLRGVEPTFIGVLTSSTDPALAAAMSLVQKCQQGDARACAEATVLQQANRKLLKKAEKLLTRGQRERARQS